MEFKTFHDDVISPSHVVIGGSRGGMPGACPPYRVEMNVFSGSQGTYCGLNETKKNMMKYT